MEQTDLLAAAGFCSAVGVGDYSGRGSFIESGNE